MLNVSLTFKWYGPTKGAGFGLYKPRPNIKTGLVFQVDARVLLRCLSKTQTPFVYGGYLFFYLSISLLDYFQVYFLFFIYSSLWTIFLAL